MPMFAFSGLGASVVHLVLVSVVAVSVASLSFFV